MLASEVAPELAGHPLARVVRLGVGRLPSALLQNQLFACQASLWLWRHRRKLDLVHANGFVSWCRADVNSSHFVHAAWIRSRAHTWRVRRDAYGLYQLIYSACNKRFERWSYRRARVIVAVSEQVRRELIENGLPPGALRVIQNGVDPEEFKPAAVSRHDLQLPDGKLGLFIGDIRTPRKNLDTLLRALVTVPAMKLLVVGDASSSPYPRLAAELGLKERVLFLGFRRDVPQLMRAADLFVFPSRYEACSLVLLEAASSGLPIVSGRATGGAELLNPECSVLLNDPEDHAELAAVLNRLLDQPANLQRMGREARRVALANSWQTMVQRYLSLYQDLLAHGRGSPEEQTRDAGAVP
jgi:glycosyltransferase involved in cell wall biosynthesis